MPRIIDFGEPFGTREFPDNATDDEIVAAYEKEQAARVTPEQYAQQIARGITLGTAREIASIPKAVGIGAAELRRAIGYVPGLDFPTRTGEEFSDRPEASEAYRLGQLIERFGESAAPAEVPELRGSFLATQVPEAVGSGVGFLLGGGATRLLRRGVTSAATRAAERALAEQAAEKGAPLALKAAAAVSEGAEIGTLGATSQFQSEYEKAINAGADRDTALKAGVLGLPIGATEAIPLSNMLRRLDRFSEGGFSRYLLTAGKEAFEEALQEAAQNFASNAVEKGLYNPAKNLLDDIAPQGAAGGIAGFLLSSLTQALGAGARRLRRKEDYATGTRTETETPSGQAPGLVEEAQGGVRVRNAPQNRLEAQAGAAPLETHLAAIDDEFLDLDKPLASQSEKVNRALRQSGFVLDALNRHGGRMGRDLYDALTGEFEAQGQAVPKQSASEYLASLGIRGLRSEGQTRSFEALGPKVEPATGRLIRSGDFATTDDVGRTVIDIPKLQAAIQSGNLQGSEAGIALLSHLLQQRPEHPLRYIELLDQSSISAGYRGRFRTRHGSPAATIELVLRNTRGEPITERTFVRLANHELLHNAVTSKIRQADPVLLDDAQRLYLFAKESGAGTDFEGHNGLSGVHEFFAEALSSSRFRNWLASLDYTSRTRRSESGGLRIATPEVRKSVFGRLLEIVKRLLKLPDFITDAFGRKIELITALDEAISVSSKLENIIRIPSTPLTALAKIEPQQAAEVQPHAQPKIATLPPVLSPIQGAQVAGAAAQLGRVAEEAYRKREAAGTQLSGLAYERQQYKTAQQELRRLTEVATGRLFQLGFSIEDNPEFFPNPTEGVGIQDGQIVVGSEFITALHTAGLAPDVANTKSLQGEVYFEREAHRLGNLRAQIDTLQRAMGYYAALKVEQAEIDKIQETINKLSGEANKLAAAQLSGRTIGERANEIEAAETASPGLLASRQSLGLDPVVEFFGRQVGGYRAFLEKAQQGAAIAEALKAGVSDSEELARRTREASAWLALPEDVRKSIYSGTPLTDEQRAAAFARLAEAFEDFDIQRQAMGALRDSRTQVINQRVRQLLDLVSSAKIKEGMQEVLIADVLAALDGETGGTGTLQSQATAQALRGRLSAIREFALKLGQNVETNGALFAWLTNPSTAVPVVSQQMATALGVDIQTLQMILAEVKKNPAFGSAVVTLINAADKKLANLPVVQLEEIQQALQQGNPEVAAAAGQKMISSAKARASLAASSQRQNLRELEKLDIERQALEQGEAMFNEVAASPEYRQLRDAVSNSPYGLVEPMDVANNTARTFRPFGGKGIPSHEGLKLDAADSPELKSEDFGRVWKWYKAAQEHLDAYDRAQTDYDADPENNPSPASLGFDLPVIRGLRDAVSRSVPGSAQVLSTQSEGSRWKVPWLVRVMNKTGWFRQHDFVAKMVGGSTGTDLRAKLGDWINHFLISRAVSQKYRDIPQLRHAAMKSHPEVQMNFQLYRTFWNEMAHWGRIFGSPLRVGFVLPASGRAVTAEDLALLKRETEFEEDLRRKVTETSPVVGVRIKKGNREFVRAGAYVGDRGMPRHLNQGATAFINRIMGAYGERGGFDINSDLGPASTNPAVAFWNERPAMLVQHVLDSTRQDRAMRLDPLMAQAERTAAAEWMASGTPPIQTVDELVTELVKHFPSAPGLNIREKVVEGLNNELNQYNTAARRLDSERRQRDAERNSKVQISFSADNEFTRPAAQLELPSELYDYGALSDADHMLIQSRANHERVVAYALALQRARADLQQRLVDYRDPKLNLTEKEAFHGATVDEAKDVLGILNKLYDDFDAAYKMGSPALTQGGWFRQATGLLTSAVLALPTVNLRNMTQGQFEVYTMSQAMGLGGQRMLFAQALLNMPKTLARYALHIGSGLAKRTDLGAAFITGKNQETFTKLVDAIAKMMFQGDYRASADRIHELGFDTREGFLERMRRLWQATSESAQKEDLGAAKIAGHRVGKLLALPTNTLKALFDRIGVEESDLTINAALLNYATMVEKRLQEVAMNYGAERERQGLTAFDATDPRFKLKPDEWAGGNQQAAKDSLGLFELFMEQAAAAEGFQFEKSLWDYYQRAKSGPTRLFTERQFDAVQRGLLAQFNASTPANRASAAAGNNVVRNLLTLQGYVSDGLLKLLNAAIGGSRDRTAISGALAKLPILGLLALMSVLIGYMVGAITGEWEKRIRGRAPSLPTPLDKDFYTSWKRFGEGTARLSLAQLFYLGDVLLAIRGEISGNRGFDPAGRLFPLSLMQRALNAVRGMWKTQPQASLGERLEPLKDVARSLVPWYTELERVFGSTINVAKQSERIIRGEAQIRDLLPEGRGNQSFMGPQYGPTTIVRRGLMEAVSRMWEAQQKGDTATTSQAIEDAKVQLQKLQAYYEAKYIKAGDTPELAAVKAQKDLWRDYQELNPVVAGLLGKRPTKAEYDLIRGGITGDRAQVVDNGIAAWQAGAQALFGRSAPITREDAAASRGGGAFPRGGAVGIPSAIPRGPAFGRRPGLGRIRRVGGLRRVGLARGPRVAAGRTAAPRSLRRGGRALGIRSLRPRRPGIRRSTLPRVRRISAGRRRIGVVPRRRRRQSV